MGIDLRTTIADVQLQNPVIMASGTFGYGQEYNKLADLDLNEIGGIVLKGTTLKPQQGNHPVRITETAAGMLNAIGLENYGLADLINNKLPSLCKFKVKVIVNIAGTSIEEYREIAARLNDVPDNNLAAIEVNISCPNVKQGGQLFGNDPVIAHKVIKVVVKSAFRFPVIAKLPPQVTDIAVIARACQEAGARALSLINTIPGMAIEIKTRRPILDNNFGGLSGPAIKPVALAKICQIYQALNRNKKPAEQIDIIGMGGIWNWQDAIEFILAGAKAIGIGTVNFYHPLAYKDILKGIGQYLTELSERENNPAYRELPNLVGTLELYKAS